MEVSGRKHVDSDIVRPRCDPCKSVDENQTAECFCTDCNEYLCSNCARVHRKTRISKNHVLLGYDNMPKETLFVGAEGYCKKHKDKTLDYYCVVHSTFYCTVCITLEHRDCTVEYIQDLVDNYEQNGEYENLTQKMKDLNRLIDEIKSETDRNVAYTQQASAKTIASIKQFRKEINAILDSLETKILDQARKIKDDDLKRLSELSSQLDSMKTELDEAKTKIENLRTTKQNKQFVISSKQLETKIAIFEKDFNGMSKTNTVKTYKFHPNETLYNKIQSIEELGNLQKEENTDGKGSNQKNKEICAVEKREQNRIPSNISHEKDIDIKHSGDENECAITGSVYMNNNRLALVDNFNKSVSVVDILQGNIVLHIKLDSRPWDITYTDQNQLVVTVAPYLVFLNVGKTLPVNKKLNVGGTCLGIDYTDNILMVSFLDPGLVKFMNMDGEVMKSISIDMNGEPLFVFPKYVVASRDKKAVYVTDSHKNTVTKLDMNGTVIDVYSSEDLRWPCGVTVDKYDNVYIAGWGSGNICILKAGSRQIQPILKVDSPQSVVVCDDSDQMVVSDVFSNDIHIYKIHRSKSH